MGPATGATRVVMAQMPMAAGCSFFGKMVSNRVCDSGIKGPPQKPWIIRATIRRLRLGDRPHRSEARPKPIRATEKTRTVPKREASHPVRGTEMASATA